MSKYEEAREALILSFVKCIDKSSFDSLSITSLCLVAGVNRSTFYANYDNLGELLEDAWKYMVDSFFAELDISEKRFDEKSHIKEKYLLPYLRFVRNHTNLYLAAQKLDAGRDWRFNALVEKVSIPSAKQNSIDVDAGKIAYITKFILDGIKGVVDMWIKGGFKEKEEEIARIICGFSLAE